MSSFAVKVERVRAVMPHSNADRLDVIQVLDWRCVAQKGAFKEGDLCVYFPIDSILPEKVESAIFGPDAKVKLSKSRVKTIKLRGEISQGLAVSQATLHDIFNENGSNHSNRWAPYIPREGEDLTAMLGVTKYEPPESSLPMGMGGSQTSRKQTNPNFAKYTDLENAKNYPGIFEDGELVYVTEKIHGTNFRAGYVPVEANTLWKRIKRFFNLLPRYEFVYGSRNVQMQDRIGGGKTWLQKNSNVKSNVYREACDKYELEYKLDDGYVVYGEVYGDGVQKGYTYGCGPGQRDLVIFDVMKDGKYLNTPEAIAYCTSVGLMFVPFAAGDGYSVPFHTDLMKSLTVGASILCPTQKVREGVVVKPLNESMARCGRKALKFVSDDYLLRDNSDFH